MIQNQDPGDETARDTIVPDPKWDELRIISRLSRMQGQIDSMLTAIGRVQALLERIEAALPVSDATRK